MTKLASRLDRLEARRPDAASDVKHIIIRSMIRPGSDEPVTAFAYLLGRMGPRSEVRMNDGETFEEFEARVKRAAENFAAKTEIQEAQQ